MDQTSIERPLLPSMINKNTVCIEEVPPEMINRICHFVTDEKSSKSLRLVSRRFRDCAAINVFQSLLLYPDRTQWALLNKIGEVPELAKLVTTVWLVRTAEFEPTVQEAFKLFGEHMRERLTETWTDSDLKAWWAKQIEWEKAEQDFHQWYHCSFPVGRSPNSDDNVEDLAPFVRLDRFPNLRNIETIGCWDKNYKDSHPGLYYWQTKEWQDLEQEGTTGFYEFHPNRCLEMFCLQLKRSGKDISSLRVTYLCEILDEPGQGLDLANFSTLTIDLAKSADYALRSIEDDEFPHPDGNFSDWFKSAARKLKNLNIIQCWITEKNDAEPLDALVPALDIFGLLNLRKLTFPTLQTLYLQHVTTTASSLTEFLNRHRKTLVSLTIVRPCIDPKDWNEMRQRIEDEVEQGYYGPESGCEIVLTDAMTDPMGNDKDWKAFDSLIQFQ